MENLTEIVETRVDVAKLRLGMYVCRLDRPWVETPYKLQGFLIESPEDIQGVGQFCQHVFIDDMRSVHSGRRIPRFDYSYLPRLTKPEKLEKLQRLGYRTMRGEERKVPLPVEYPAPIMLAKELPRARPAWKQARLLLNQLVAKAKGGKSFDPEELDAVVVPVVDSVVRSPDAALWMVALRRGESYPLSHPLNCCAMLMAFGRHLGFPPEQLLPMAKGALLMDIGMWRLKQNYYIHRDSVDAVQREEITEHVILGLDWLEQSGFLDFDARLMILHHHERADNTGYPRAVRGVKVSLMGYMLGLIDTFDALCSRRSHHCEETLANAQRILYKERDTAFPAEVFEEFFQALGVYPTGTLLELSDGSIAAVSGQSPASRLYPKLVPLTAPDRTPLTEFVEIESATLIKSEPSIRIVRTLPPGSSPMPLERVELKVPEEA
jgi:HD-GYP domain-containing protein (c-di-GMP phosphodiesterase class II)